MSDYQQEPDYNFDFVPTNPHGDSIASETRSREVDPWKQEQQSNQFIEPKVDEVDQGIEKVRETFLERSGRKTVKPKEEELGEEEKKPDPKPDPKPEPEDRYKKSIDDLTSSLSKVADRFNAKDDPKPEEPKSPEFDSETEKSLAIIEEMERHSPEKHPGITKAAKDYYNKLGEYKQKWIQENPGSDFKLEDDEHSDFIERNHPQFEERDYLLAEGRLDSRKELNQTKAEFKRKEFLDEAQKAEQRIRPEITSEIIKGIDPELGEFLQKDPSKFSALREDDPIAFEEIERAVDAASRLSSEFYKLTKSDGLYQYNPKDNDHLILANTLQTYEQKIASRTREERDFEGRDFATHEQYRKIPADQKKNYWVIDSENMNAILNKEFSDIAKKKIEARKEDTFKYVPEKYRDKAKMDYSKKARWRKPSNNKGSKPPAGGDGGQTSTFGKQNNDDHEEWQNILLKGRR